jgi:energy-coupling factor transporter ATP-binding protein EcfA2
MATRAIARTTKEAYASIHPDEALGSNDERYVSLDAARGTHDVAQWLSSRISALEDAYKNDSSTECARFLVTGHRGCGKTTELNRLRELLVQAQFAVVYFDSEVEFDPQKQNVNWWNVLLEMVWQIDEQLSREPYRVQASDDLRDTAVEWLARVVTKKSVRTEIEASLTAELEAGAGLSFFAKARAAIKALVKTGSSTVREIEIEAERRPTVLRDAAGGIIHSVHEALARKGYHRLVIIVDGLEKIPLRQLGDGLTTHNVLFMHNGNHLKAPPCHLIYTLPLALLTSANVGMVFPERPILLPMVRVHHRNGREDARALRLLSELISRRVAPEVFAPGVIKMLAIASGGHIRDFLSLVREATTGFGERIMMADAKRAIAALIGIYERTIEQEFIEPLDHVARHGILPGGPHDGELVNRLLVLEYHNDEVWSALHPCVQSAPRYVRSPRANEAKSGA